MRIYLMPDYGSSSIWSEPTGGMVELHDLDLSAKTRAGLKAWSARMWELIDYFADEKPVPREWNDAQRRIGLELWNCVRDELDKDRYTVGIASAIFQDLTSTTLPRIIWDPRGVPSAEHGLPDRPET